MTEWNLPEKKYQRGNEIEIETSTDYWKLPKKKYRIILSDPPWVWKNYSDSWHEEHLQDSRWVGNNYPLIPKEGLHTLPVASIADKDCVLFLWATYPTLPTAFEIIKGWGFEYKTVAFTWVKTNKKSGTPFMGLGFWTRSNAEVCLLATRGKPKRVAKNVQQIILAPRREHSRKPDEARERIVELLGDIPRIELFARERVDGWDSWGNEV